MAAREAEVFAHALDAIDEAIRKLRVDLRATETKWFAGEWVEVHILIWRGLVKGRARWPGGRWS